MVNRITILVDKFTGHPKGYGVITPASLTVVSRYAYVEFKDADAINNAMLMNGTEFKGRPLKV